MTSDSDCSPIDTKYRESTGYNYSVLVSKCLNSLGSLSISNLELEYGPRRSVSRIVCRPFLNGTTPGKVILCCNLPPYHVSPCMWSMLVSEHFTSVKPNDLLIILSSEICGLHFSPMVLFKTPFLDAVSDE